MSIATTALLLLSNAPITQHTLDDAASPISVAFDSNGGRLTVTQKDGPFTWKNTTTGGGDAVSIGVVTQPDATHLSAALTHTSSGAALTLSLELVPATGELRLTLSGANASIGGNGIKYPYAFHAVGQSNTGLAVLPFDSGYVLPESQTSYTSKFTPFLANRGMGWFGGTDRDEARGWIGIFESYADVELHTVTGVHEGASVIGGVPKWISSNGSATPTLPLLAYDRTTSFRFVSSGGYVALAKRFRAWAAAQGWVKTLAQKNAEDPERKTDRLIGAPVLYLWGDGRSTAMLSELDNAGLRKAVVQLSVNHLDEQRQFPNAADPDGDGWMLAARARGFLPGFYDIYAGLRVGGAVPFYDGTSYLWPTSQAAAWAYYDAAGNPDANTSGSTTMYSIAARKQAEFCAATRLPAHIAQFGVDAYFFDTTCAGPAREDYDTNNGHFATRSMDIQSRVALLDTAYSNGVKRLVTGTEQGRSWAVAVIHWGEGKFWLGETGNLSPSDSGAWNDTSYPQVMVDVVDPTALATNKLGPLLSHGWQAPLWELVFHDCMVTTTHWSRAHNKFLYAWDQADRWALLRGQAPLLNLTYQGAQGLASRTPNTLTDALGNTWSSRWSTMRARFEQTFATVCAWHEQVGYLELIDHAWLASDRSVQKSEFSADGGASGRGIVVNFGNYDGAFGVTGAAWSGTLRGIALTVPAADYRTYAWGPPVAYCTAGTSTHGCVPSITATGTPSASATSGFTLAVAGAEGQKAGLMFYGLSGRAAAPWSSGGSSFLCVKAPTQRMALADSGGTQGVCDGAFNADWLAFLAAHPGALGAPAVAGALVDAQCWYRDPQAAGTTNLSNGLEFTLVP